MGGLAAARSDSDMKKCVGEVVQLHERIALPAFCPRPSAALRLIAECDYVNICNQFKCREA